jgi:hypothetical protein
VARRTLADAKAAQEAHRIRTAWDNYVAAGGALAAIRQCEAIWPTSLADLAPVQCQLLAGHDGDHRHRIMGTQSTVNW